MATATTKDVMAAQGAVAYERWDHARNTGAEDEVTLRKAFTSICQGRQDLIGNARHRLNKARYGLDLITAKGSQVDAAIDALATMLADFGQTVAAFKDEHLLTDGEITGGLDTSGMTLDSWGAAVHERLLTKCGDFSIYLQGASNTPSYGVSSVAGWTPTYEGLRDG